MKKSVILLLLIALSSMSHSQTAVCKKFLANERIQTYCVDNYPLGNDDSINVTFLVATESRFYDTIRLFLSSLSNPKSEVSISVPSGIVKGGNQPQKPNSFIIRYSETLSGDKGHYLTFLSSCNMTAMIFHIRDDKDMKKVITHVLANKMIVN